jgi:hypothetical protein
MLLSIPATIDGALLRAVDAEYHEERFALARQDLVRFLAGGRFGRALRVRIPKMNASRAISFASFAVSKSLLLSP